jgi:selenocysteine lyase/cysteine desulfurase
MFYTTRDGVAMSDSYPITIFDRFRAALAGEDPLCVLREGLIGKSSVVDGPFGPKPILYCDYTASGRALRQLEDIILEDVLPFYANSHTEASYCGARMTAMRRSARQVVAHACGAGPDHAVIFSGSGATAGLNRLVHLLGVSRAVSRGEDPLVLIGPYEHHSNILPWRESGASVERLPEGANGGPDLSALQSRARRGERAACRRRLLGGLECHGKAHECRRGDAPPA